jgi:hypothetical protein
MVMAASHFGGTKFDPLAALQFGHFWFVNATLPTHPSLAARLSVATVLKLAGGLRCGDGKAESLH